MTYSVKYSKTLFDDFIPRPGLLTHRFHDLTELVEVNLMVPSFVCFFDQHLQVHLFGVHAQICDGVLQLIQSNGSASVCNQDKL